MTSLIGKKGEEPSHVYTNSALDVARRNKTTSDNNSGYEEAIDNNKEPSQHTDLADNYSKLVSLPRPLALVDSTRRGSDRVANPYAVDDPSVVISKGIINDGYEESRDFDPVQAHNTLNGSFIPGELYQTIPEAKGNPVRKLSRKLKQSFKGRKRRHSNRELDPYAVDLVEDDSNAKNKGRSNFVYEDVNDDHSHQYADLGDTIPKKPELPIYPRQTVNKLYEPYDDKEKKRKNSEESATEKRCCCLRESQLIKLLLFVIIFLFLLCLFLVILLITGTLRVQASDGTEQDKSSSQQKSASVQPMQASIASLQKNVTELQKLLKAQEKVNITSLQKDFSDKLNLVRSNLETDIQKSVRQAMALNETIRKTSQQFSLSVNPIKKTIAELRANLTELEALLNKTKAQANVQTNGSISILDVKENFDQKLNATKDQLQAADGRIKGEVKALNISLINKIQGISAIEGKQGPPGLNGSRGEPGPQGVQGPPGLGNFSQCRHSVESQTTHDQSVISITVNKLQPNGYIILSAFCSTVGTKEHKLEIFVPKDGNPNFVCTCKGKSTLFPTPNSKYSCNLNYFICPKTT